MVDTSKLRGRIVEKYRTQEAFCKAVGKSHSFVSQYMNGKKVLDQPTIIKWAEALDIPSKEIDIYFFKVKVHEIEQ